MNSLLHEISQCRYYLMQPSVFAGLRSNVLNFLRSGEAVAPGKRENERRSVARFLGRQLVTDHHKLTHFKAYDDEWDDNDAQEQEMMEDVKYIHILRLTGSMTRGGGECSYGSIELRDKLMEVADRDDVVAHIIYCRTPGGMATTLLDFRKAISYIHERGQKIYMFCDGTVASAGVFLSAMCDGVYAFNGDDEIGSIGMYTAFFTMENGAKNAITQETYVEYYAEKSTEKNRPYRDGGDMELIAKETNEYLDELLADMKRDRPSIQEEQMNGAMFKMKNVVGTIIDGICTLPELCEMAYREWELSKEVTNQINNEAMSKEYQNLAKIAGYEAEATMVSDNEGLLTLQPQEADAMEEKLGDLMASVETLSVENTQLKENNVALETSLNEAKEAHATVVAELEATKEKLAQRDDTQIQEVRTEMQAQLDDVSAKYETLETEKKGFEDKVAELNVSVNELNASLAASADKVKEQEQIISDLQAQLTEAQSGSGSKVNAGESPKTNGEKTGAPTMTAAPAWDPSKTASENVEALQKYMAKQKNSVK